ncbi:hypothetical protein [Nocardioides aurantiacus]|uniref:Uncharacterized protein n=1 Tax=Nocardioides aurantiacus TaxID=86796 RepID=A0A3N2CWC5_9ACTN|nr:hypothetical protein [Nocardioides aurantiacus]ROR91718.1 hypothetical protein EDD33_2593 [Nocardioides aurantiacus]
MSAAEVRLAENLSRRIELMWQRFDETGDVRWLIAADKSEAALQRLRQRVAS